MKHLERITAVLVLLLLLTACGGSHNDSEPLTDCSLGVSKIGNCKL